MKTYQVNDEGFYGNFGGAYIPEILYQCVEQLKDNYRKVLDSDDFRQEFHSLLRDYVGRPSPLYLAKRLSERYGCRIYLKREDLNHTGAHKINNAIGQVLLARRMGKKRIIAETGAGQHGADKGVATTAQSGLNDRTIQPHRLYPSRRVSRRLFPIPFHKDRQTKARMLRAFKKTFRRLKEKTSGF